MALYVGADESHAWYVLTVVTSPLRMRPGVTWHCYGLSRRVVPHWPCVLYVVRRVWFSSVSHELPVCLFRSPRRHWLRNRRNQSLGIRGFRIFTDGNGCWKGQFLFRWFYVDMSINVIMRSLLRYFSDHAIVSVEWV